jgi:hypothetical protein
VLLAGAVGLVIGGGMTAEPIDSKLPGPLSPVYWLGFATFYLYGVVTDGSWAVVLGELGWLALRRTRLPKRLSLGALGASGAAVGVVIGCANVTLSHELAVLHMSEPPPFPQWAPSWLGAAIAGGVIGGVLVASHLIAEQQDSSKFDKCRFL